MKCTADGNRILSELEKLKTFDMSGPEQPGTTRMLFTDVEMEAREYVKSLMLEIGMSVDEDAIGNIYGTLRGSDPELAPVWSGSHIDTVINAGMYDGMFGVIGAIESCRYISENDIPHKRSIQVIIYSSEEPTRFGMGCVGSRAMAGELPLEDTKNVFDDNGISLYDELERLGFTKKDYDKTVLKKKGDVFASVEMHIEQAPVLEQKGIPIGIVEGICAPSYIQVCIEGEQKHAGSTPMNVRRDAMTGAAEIILRLESLARSYGNTHTVATVGKLSVFPNASNVIPGKVSFTIDIRDVDESVKTELTEKICSYIDCICTMRGLIGSHEITTDDIPCYSDPAISAVIEETCRENNIPYNRMTSGAYHDSLLISDFVPVAMIFVPSHNGISHDPAEFTELSDLVTGTEVLCGTLIKLSNLDSL
ncbi:MAG: M20 family metallo-hydrolase [Eubacteriales bacterium]|nr:M20 family metallo-hydrolase [Eubacteriales bacterium]